MVAPRTDGLPVLPAPVAGVGAQERVRTPEEAGRTMLVGKETGA
jgi:hypothetical protein